MGQVSWTRVAFISILLASLAFPLSPAGRTAYHQPKVEDAPVAIASQSLPPLVAEYHGFIANSAKSDGNLDPGISGEFASRFQKNTLLVTSVGSRSFLPPKLAGCNGPPIKTIRTSP